MMYQGRIFLTSQRAITPSTPVTINSNIKLSIQVQVCSLTSSLHNSDIIVAVKLWTSLCHNEENCIATFRTRNEVNCKIMATSTDGRTSWWYPVISKHYNISEKQIIFDKTRKLVRRLFLQASLTEDRKPES